MLILTRRVGEKIKIGDDIEIMVGAIKGNSAKICISAPQHIKIYRDEIYHAMQNEKLHPTIIVTRSKSIQQIEKGNAL